MGTSQVQDYAIQACLALAVGAEDFDRLFAGVHFDATGAPLLFVYVKDDDIAEKVADHYARDIVLVASSV